MPAAINLPESSSTVRQQNHAAMFTSCRTRSRKVLDRWKADEEARGHRVGSRYRVPRSVHRAAGTDRSVPAASQVRWLSNGYDSLTMICHATLPTRFSSLRCRRKTSAVRHCLRPFFTCVGAQALEVMPPQRRSLVGAQTDTTSGPSIGGGGGYDLGPFLDSWPLVIVTVVWSLCAIAATLLYRDRASSRQALVLTAIGIITLVMVLLFYRNNPS